ncbi:CotH kinase family protein [Sphingobacterium sp. HJSM2_6]|uniref:CotH kinase family protein n=1 Tax=Sphingobacterium sp. HJSM2_6 TaxID=3366264 RepID=UPI003BDF1A41
MYKTFTILRFILFSFISIQFIGCTTEKAIVPELSGEHTLSKFLLKKEAHAHLWFDIETEIIGDTIFARTMKDTYVGALIPEFEHTGVKVLVNQVEQKSKVNTVDFSKPIKYEVVAENGESKSYTVKFIDTGLPAVYLFTDGKPIVNKEDYVTGQLKITRGFEGKVLYEGVTEVKGRGNSTWGMPKKPYRIKLDKKAELLGMPSDKSWALMANYGDQSLLRNDIAFEVSRRVGVAYSPRQKYVEFFLNGEYQGNYTLTEHIKEGSHRVPIDEENGGYILEQDGYAFQEPVHFVTAKNIPITVKFPDEDEITSTQYDYIKDHFATFENSLFQIGDQVNTDYQDYFDLTSFVNYYLANEICGNTDMFWSMRMYKKSNADPKIYVGPVWDFDLGFNNDRRLNDYQEKLMLEHAHNPRAWIDVLKDDPAFKKLVRSRWIEVKAGLQNLPQYIDQQAKLISYSQPYNFKKWDVLGENINQSWFTHDTHQGYVDFVRNFIAKRIQWLDTVIQGPKFD